MQTQYALLHALLRNAVLHEGTGVGDHLPMAIQFARARYISRSSGGNAVRSAAYNGRDAIAAERTGELFYFRHRDALQHHEVLLPEDTAEHFRESAVLWNAAEAAEKRKDAQVAREIVVALPANAEISDEDRIELVRSFAEQHFVAKGLAVQLDVHAPHEGDAESERANWHAHLLITTRRLEGDRFAAKKARDLDDRYFAEHGLGLRVDPTAAYAAPHIGPVRMRVEGSEIVERAEQIRQANEEAARDPEQVLATLTRHNATFTERDLDRYLAALDESVPLANLLLELLDMLLGSGVWANAGVAISTVVHASAALLTAALPAGARRVLSPLTRFSPFPRGVNQT